MATWDDVRRIALALHETSETVSHGNAFWVVRDKGFVWERPLRNSDRKALGDGAPTGPILGARVEHLIAKEALLAEDPGVFFTTPHFDGYPAVLVPWRTLPTIRRGDREVWLRRAPKRLAKAYADGTVGSQLCHSAAREASFRGPFRPYRAPAAPPSRTPMPCAPLPRRPQIR
jgi:hypothetical protein